MFEQPSSRFVIFFQLLTALYLPVKVVGFYSVTSCTKTTSLSRSLSTCRDRLQQHYHGVSSSVMMAKGRRGSLNIDPESLSNGGGNKRPLNSPGSGSTNKKSNWQLTSIPSLSTLSTGDSINEVKLVDTLTVPSLIHPQTNPTGAVSILNYNEKVTYCFSASCPSCKIPLNKAEVVTDDEINSTINDEVTTEAMTRSKDPLLQCSFCGATYNLRTGKPVKRDKKKLFGFLFSNSKEEALPVYGLGEKGGKVYINIP